MIVAYATQADNVAHDGNGRNSPFSEAFIKELREPGIEVGTLFRRVGADVFASTGGAQAPELSITMVPEYYLNASETDKSVWARIRSNDDPEALRTFLVRFPDSFFAPDAKARLQILSTRSNGVEPAPLPLQSVAVVQPLPASKPLVDESRSPSTAIPAVNSPTPAASIACPKGETASGGKCVVLTCASPMVRSRDGQCVVPVQHKEPPTTTQAVATAGPPSASCVLRVESYSSIPACKLFYGYSGGVRVGAFHNGSGQFVAARGSCPSTFPPGKLLAANKIAHDGTVSVLAPDCRSSTRDLQ